MQKRELGKKAQTHQRIVETASKAIRRDGYDGVSVAKLMKEAGLTHGGFYAHFPSREVMLFEAMEKAIHDGQKDIMERVQQRIKKDSVSAFRAFIELYLSEQHLAMKEQGCPIASLGSEISRQSKAVRQISCMRIEHLQATLASMLSEQVSPAEVTLILSSAVGAIQLARSYNSSADAFALLINVREALLAQYDR